MIKEALLWVGGIISFVLLMLALDYFIGLKWFAFIAPQKESVRREVFENTRSFNEAKKQDLLKYRYEYIKSGKEEKEAIASTIRQMYADYDESRLPVELRDFLHEIKYGVSK